MKAKAIHLKYLFGYAKNIFVSAYCPEEIPKRVFQGIYNVPLLVSLVGARGCSETRTYNKVYNTR